MANLAALPPAVDALVHLYKANCRVGDRPMTDHVRDIMWIGNAVDFLALDEQALYYREAAKYRLALWQAENVIEWPD